MILYVDDEPINLKLFEVMFRGKFEILVAESGVEALELLKDNESIKVIVSDMKMPLMNGLEFIQEAKKINSKIPYYLLSGYGINEEISEALNSGLIKGYYQKPFKRNVLEEEFVKCM